MVKNPALTVNIFITYEEIISTYIPTYKGNSLQKSLHNYRCYFGFTFEVRFCHVISCICIAISESGDINSQAGKPKALVRWFSQLISGSVGGFDVNCMDNISTLQNSITRIKKIVTTNLMGCREVSVKCTLTVDVAQYYCNPILLWVKTTYAAFLDVTKAYDKAWLDGIMYAMHKRGFINTTGKS